MVHEFARQRCSELHSIVFFSPPCKNCSSSALIASAGAMIPLSTHTQDEAIALSNGDVCSECMKQQRVSLQALHTCSVFF